MDGVKDGGSPLVLMLDVFKERLGGGFILKLLRIMSRCSAIWKLEVCSGFGGHEDKGAVLAKFQIVCFRL
jgi:hypothetical protein